LLVGDEMAVDDVGQLPLQSTQRFHRAFAFGALAAPSERPAKPGAIWRLTSGNVVLPTGFEPAPPA